MQYSVIDITEQPIIMANGKVSKAYRVTVSMGERGSFTLQVPESEFNPANVKKLVDERAKTMREVMELQG